MDYTIVRVANLYPEMLRDFYAGFPETAAKPYAEQYHDLTMFTADVSSSFTAQLNRCGVHAHTIYSNAEHLQRQWGIEKNKPFTGKELIFEQIAALKPEVIWLDDTRLIDATWLSHIRKEIPSVRVVCGHSCAPYSSENIRNFKALDLLFTCTPCFKQEFERNGIETHLIYHAFEPSILDRISSQNEFPQNDFIFSGSLFTGGWFHKTRIDYLEKLTAHKIPIKIYGNIDSTSKILSKITAYYTINGIRKLGARKLIESISLLKHYESYGDTPVSFYSRKLRARLYPPAFGIEQFKLLSKAKMCFNIHLDQAKKCAGNMRLFEATGVGSCLITDWKENLYELFEPESEVVTYNSMEECLDKVKWLLQHPSEVEKIGKAGQARTLRDHTVEKRVNAIHGILTSRLRS